MLFPLVEPAIAELEGALRAVVAAGDKLLWLSGQGVVQIRRAAPGGTVQDEGELEARARRAVQHLDMRLHDWTAIMRELHETTRRTADWDEALAALIADPEAALPR